MNTMYKLSEIYVYPVKSLGGIRVNGALAGSKGLQHDRRWMVIDESGVFLSQRTAPQMARLAVELPDSGLRIIDKTGRMDALEIGCPDKLQRTQATVWGDVCDALAYGDEVNEWLTTALGLSCRLVYMPDWSRRPVDPAYAPGREVGFADAFPFLIAGLASLEHLNRQLTTPVPMNRFRPNLVFAGGEPHAEDAWREFSVGPVCFQAVKPCARCVITTTDQETGERGPEPLRTLARYRTRDGKVMFGMNVVALSEGTITVGDEIVPR